jgi:hypothetical protein
MLRGCDGESSLSVTMRSFVLQVVGVLFRVISHTVCEVCGLETEPGSSIGESLVLPCFSSPEVPYLFVDVVDALPSSEGALPSVIASFVRLLRTEASGLALLPSCSRTPQGGIPANRPSLHLFARILEALFASGATAPACSRHD